MDLLNYPEIESRHDLSSKEFFCDYVGKKSVIMRGLAKNWLAIHHWDKEYFVRMAPPERTMAIKILRNVPGKNEATQLLLRNYISQILNRSEQHKDIQNPAYFYDAPLPTLLGHLKNDLQPFPVDYFPKWYQMEWWKNLFFFSTEPGTVIPMHFDSLGTHNTYFHLKGQKKIIIVSSAHLKKCYMYDYNSSAVNPEYPDFERFPLFKQVEPQQAFLLPGDVLYLPPYTLHQVKSLDACMSVKIDWHSKKSVLCSFKNIAKGCKMKDTYYNFIFMLGIIFKLPSGLLYPHYKKSLSRLRHFHENYSSL